MAGRPWIGQFPRTVFFDGAQKCLYFQRELPSLVCTDRGIIVRIAAGVVTFILLKVTGVLTSGLRVTREEELIGLDITHHEEEGYKL